MASDDQLAAIRADIDSIDKQLLELINARAECARRVAQIKLAESQDGNALFYRPEREAQILRAIQERNPGPLPPDQAARIFREIMSSCLALERPLTVGFLGPAGTYSQAAALKHFGQSAILEPQPTIRDVFRLAEDKACDMAVVPVENSTEGMVGQTLDCFLESPLQIIGEVELPVVHHLIAAAAQDLSSISVVCGHEQALGQCRDWLDANLPGVARDVCRSNGEAAQRAQSEPGVAAIAGDLAVENYQLVKLAEAIQDIAHNTTRFFVVGRETVPSSGADKTSILIASRNRPGALLNLLRPFEERGISLTRIDSRPSKTEKWTYMFFIEFEGHLSDDVVREVMAALEENSIMLKPLGSYPKAPI